MIAAASPPEPVTATEATLGALDFGVPSGS